MSQSSRIVVSVKRQCVCVCVCSVAIISILLCSTDVLNRDGASPSLITHCYQTSDNIFF